MGVCSVQYGDNVIALSPRRFLQRNIVFENIADHHFNTRNNLVVFKEVNLKRIGNFDFVMVKHKPLSTEIEDFIVIELQTAQTTSTGRLVEALKEYLRGENLAEKTYGFGLNQADIWKRTFTQILNKGIVLERWGHKIYWVVQEPIYQDFLKRYRLTEMKYDKQQGIVFAIYDLRPHDNEYELYQTRIESSTTKYLFEAFSNNPDIPSKDVFMAKLKEKLEKGKLQLQLNQE